MHYELVFKINTHYGSGQINTFTYQVEEVREIRLTGDRILSAQKRIHKEANEKRISEHGEEDKQNWSTSVEFISHSCYSN